MGRMLLLLLLLTFIVAISSERSCPFERGFCVSETGRDQNAGVYKLASKPGMNVDTTNGCLKACQARQGNTTGCERIWDQKNAGCYVHTEAIHMGNLAPRHMCWVFSKCTTGEESSTPPLSLPFNNASNSSMGLIFVSGVDTKMANGAPARVQTAISGRFKLFVSGYTERVLCL